MVICLERDADLHMAQLMPLPLTVSCFSKIQIGFTFLVPAHPGSPVKRAVKQMCVCVRACVRACVCACVASREDPSRDSGHRPRNTECPGKYGTVGNPSHSPWHSVVCINDVIATRDFCTSVRAVAQNSPPIATIDTT